MPTTPWWRALKLRPEVADNAGNIDDVQMSLFRAVYEKPPATYGDPEYYGSITHPTTTLADLMSRIAIRLGGSHQYTMVKALYRLDQGMGGGKSHGLIGLYHMASNFRLFGHTDIGKMAAAQAANMLGGAVPDLEGTHVVVLCADNMTPGVPDKDPQRDGPAETLWERFLWRLVKGNYGNFIKYKNRVDQDGIRDALRSAGGPVLVLVDEIMDYVRLLGDEKYGRHRNEDLSFLKALMDAVDDVPHVAMVVVMIASDKDPIDYRGEVRDFHDELEQNLVRNGSRMGVTEASDFSQIIRRRLFDSSTDLAALEETAALFSHVSSQWDTVFSRTPGYNPLAFAHEVAHTYPFHPDLMRLVENEWSALTGYQRVRSTVTLFAQMVYNWMKCAQEGGWAPLLIGPGDLQLERSPVREALLNSGVVESQTTIANYRQVVASDIVAEGGSGGMATELDVEFAGKVKWSAVNPRAAQRMATALLLFSLAPRSGGRLGATEAEILSASFVPDPSYPRTDAETLFNGLKDPETGLGTLEIISGPVGQATRYHLSTRQTLRMLIRQQRNAVTDEEKDDLIAEEAEHLIIKSGGFTKPRFVRNEFDSDGRPKSNRDILSDLDERDSTRLVVLDSSRWTLLNGADDETRQAIRMAFGVGQNALPVTHAASLVIACANTQRRSRARDRAAEYLARTRVLTVQSVQDDQAMASQARAEADDAKRNLQREVKRAYQHYAYLVRNPEGELTVGFGKFDDDAKTALSGANVWDKLAQEGRAVTPGALNLDGLMLSLENQLPRSLSEVVNLFWTNPRMPMLSGVEELRRALFEALRTDRLEIVNGEGVIQAPVDKPTDLPIASHSLTLRLPTPAGRVSTDGSNGDSSYGESGDYSLFPIADDVGVNGDRTETEGSKGSVVSSGERVSLWLKAQASLASHDKQEAMGALLQHIKILITNSKPDEVENIILTVEFVGDKAKLQSCVRSAERLHGTKHQFEDLP